MLLQRLREGVLPALDSVLETVGLYAAYDVDADEYIGTVWMPLGVYDVGQYLRGYGYEESALSALKYHPETGESDDASLRRVDPQNPYWQWHVHLWESPGGSVEVFSHYELRPDLNRVADESVAGVVARVREHYRPTWGHEQRDDTTYVLGASCPIVDNLVGK